MSNSVELIKRTHKYLDDLRYEDTPDCGCCTALYSIKIDGFLLMDLFDKLLNHPFILESTCKDCEEIQNSMDNICDTILEGDKRAD